MSVKTVWWKPADVTHSLRARHNNKRRINTWQEGSGKRRLCCWRTGLFSSHPSQRRSNKLSPSVFGETKSSRQSGGQGDCLYVSGWVSVSRIPACSPHSLHHPAVTKTWCCRCFFFSRGHFEGKRHRGVTSAYTCWQARLRRGEATRSETGDVGTKRSQAAASGKNAKATPVPTVCALSERARAWRRMSSSRFIHTIWFEAERDRVTHFGNRNLHLVTRLDHWVIAQKVWNVSSMSKWSWTAKWQIYKYGTGPRIRSFRFLWQGPLTSGPIHRQ